MFRKAPFVIVLALLMLVVAPFALAQEETFGLSAEDYALFTSQDANFDSISFDFALALDVSGVPGSETTVNFSGSGLFGESDAGLPVGSFNLSGNANTDGEDTPVDVQVVIVDGVAYLNLGDESGWIGQPLDEAMEGLSNMAPLPVDPVDLASGDFSDNPEAMEAFGTAMGAFANMEPSEFVSITRLEDMDGQAHFQTSLDLASFFSSESFTELMGAAGTMSGDESVSEMGPMVAMLLSNSSLTFDQYIDTSTNQIRQGVLDFAMTVDPAMMGAESDAEPINVGFNLDVSNVQYDVPVEVTAPEGATMIPSSTE